MVTLLLVTIMSMMGHVVFLDSLKAKIRYQSAMKPISLLNNEKLQVIDNEPNIWGTRRKLIRYFLKNEAKKRLLNKDEPVSTDPNLTTKATIGISAFFIAIGATIFRFGGRAAFVQFLGLDFITNQDFKSQIDGFISSFDSLGDIRYLAFLGCWIVAKFICIDFCPI